VNKHSSNSRLETTEDIDAIAADWMARRYGGFSVEESAAFEAWMSADPRHASAVADIEKAWRVVSSPALAGRGAIAQERFRVRERHQVRRRRRASLATLGLGAAALVIFALLPSRRIDVESVSSRIVLRPDLQILPDGSRAQLNLGAEIVTAFTAEKRLVKLVRGEALFTVTKDTTRPFVVSAGAIEVKAVGTAFAVRYDPVHVEVLVTEGTVAVNRAARDIKRSEEATLAASSSDALVLTAGHRTLVPLGAAIGPVVSRVPPAQTRPPSRGANGGLNLLARHWWKRSRFSTGTTSFNSPLPTHKPERFKSVEFFGRTIRTVLSVCSKLRFK
jgi:transmembrane sensor